MPDPEGQMVVELTCGVEPVFAEQESDAFEALFDGVSVDEEAFSSSCQVVVCFQERPGCPGQFGVVFTVVVDERLDL